MFISTTILTLLRNAHGPYCYYFCYTLWRCFWLLFCVLLTRHRHFDTSINQLVQKRGTCTFQLGQPAEQCM